MASPQGNQADQWNQKPGFTADFAEGSDNLNQGSEQIGADAELQRNLERVAAQEAWLDAGNSKEIDLNVVGEGIAELTDHALALPIRGLSTTSQNRTLVVVDSRVGNWGELAGTLQRTPTSSFWIRIGVVYSKLSIPPSQQSEKGNVMELLPS